MPDDDWAVTQQKRDIELAEAERFQQAGFLALVQLQPELASCVTFEQFQGWCERVNARAAEIMARPH
jgi:hypothetical protein